MIQLKIEHHQVIMEREKKEKVVATICGKSKLPKESIKKKNVTNKQKFITQSEALAIEVIVVNKLRTDISVHSVLTVETRASITPDERIPKKEKKYKINIYVATKKVSSSQSR